MTRVLAIADTDSYLKWSAATLAAMPTAWRRTQLVIENPVMPSAAQITAATALPVEVLSRAAVCRRIRELRPDVLLLAGTGPVVADLSGDRTLRTPDRPVLLTGLPGISVPATRSAIRFRTGCDLFVLHSHREVSEFAELAQHTAPRLEFGLARLPFLGAEPVSSTERSDLLFAAQAKVPVARAERESILLALAEAGGAVVKVRAQADEQQTHHEAWPYPELLADLIDSGRIAPDAVRCVGGSMAEALATARGLVTVSSTAALEAMAADVPVLIISDFGISAEMINIVFADSGCLGTLTDLSSGRLPRPRPEWLEANYFHPEPENDWLIRLERLLEIRAAGGLPRPVRTSSVRKRIRRRLRLLVPAAVARPLLRARSGLRARFDLRARAGRPERRLADAGQPPGRTTPGPRRAHPGSPVAAEPTGGSPAAHQPRRPASPPGSSARHH